MQIIQSFAKYEGNPYLDRKSKADYYYLNFYSMLLSYVTLQQQYGSVTMFCDNAAHESLIKYVPYDNIEIVENQNDLLMWSKYKLDIMKLIGEDFIHVDQDVVVFDDFYKPFINGECDVLVQDVISRQGNLTKPFINDNLKYFKETKILTKPYDGQGFSCGSVGLTTEVQKEYFSAIDVLYNDMLKVGLKKLDFAAMILEEILLYLITIENDFSYHYILEQKDVDNVGMLDAGDKIGYVHLWAGNKFKQKYLIQIRNKLVLDYPEFKEYILKFEREVMSQKPVFRYMFFR
jgi:hypothetical protein